MIFVAVAVDECSYRELDRILNRMNGHRIYFSTFNVITVAFCEVTAFLVQR